MESPLDYFSSLTDPRVARTREHRLEDILFIAIASIICGAESWNDMEEFGKAKEDWLRTFLALPGGIPSHDTFNRLFSALDPQELERCFMDWTRSVADLCENEVIAIDGKSMRGTRSSGNKSIVLYLEKQINDRYFYNRNSRPVVTISERNYSVKKGSIID